MNRLLKVSGCPDVRLVSAEPKRGELLTEVLVTQEQFTELFNAISANFPHVVQYDDKTHEKCYFTLLEPIAQQIHGLISARLHFRQSP